MKIAQIAPLIESVPPTLYGGTERVVSWLTEELVAQGHKVTLFASGDSVTRAELVPVVPKALRLDTSIRDCLPYNFILLDQVARRADEFDILHFHIDFFHYPQFRSMAPRTLTTLHGRLDLPDLQPIYKAFPHMPLASISDHQRRPMPPVNWVGTVHHGLPPRALRPGSGKGGYLAFLGRVTADKGPIEAIEIAERAGLPLKIAAKVDAADRDYYETVVAPRIAASPVTEFIGEINDAQKQDFLGNARALLFPICWPEPFGLVMIEAMACGTPIIAFRHGSVPEVMEDGASGYVVEDVAQAVAAIGKLERLDRMKVRSVFDRRFTAPVMTRNYVAIYEKLLSEGLSQQAA